MVAPFANTLVYFVESKDEPSSFHDPYFSTKARKEPFVLNTRTVPKKEGRDESSMKIVH